MRQQARRLREELSGVAPSAVVKILVNRVILCYFDAYDADFTAGAVPGDIPLRDFYDRRRTRASRRLNDACKALAMVRRLESPGFEVNLSVVSPTKV
jgi:hypothetical protein